MKKIVLTKDAPQPIGPYSQAVMAGNLLFISGQIPLKADGSMAGADIVTQTKQVLDNLGAILKCQDMTYENVVKTTVYLKDLGDFGAMNEIYWYLFHSKSTRTRSFAS